MPTKPSTNINETVGPIQAKLDQEITLTITRSDDHGFVFVDGVHVWDRMNNSAAPVPQPLRQFLRTRGRHVLQVDCEDIGAGGDNHWALEFTLAFQGEPESSFNRLFFDYKRYDAGGVSATTGVRVVLDLV